MRDLPNTTACDVISIDPLNHHVYRVFLHPHEPLDFYAGQYLEILLPSGQACAFSIANAPHQRDIELHIRLNARDALSGMVIDHIKHNKVIHILESKGDCQLHPQTFQPLIFIAASTCFSQIKGLLEFAFQQNFNQPLYFYWGVRHVDDFYLLELPKHWQVNYPNFHFIPVVAEPSVEWQGRQGVVHKAVMADFPNLTGMRVYACGSPNMIYAVLDDFILHGLDENEFYSDVLDYAPRPCK